MRFAEHESLLAAISKSQASFQFDLKGNILEANQNFLDTMGYRLDEIVGRHHSMFVPEEMRQSPQYAAFWDKLRRGEYKAAEYKRIGKGGREVWIQATYNPVLMRMGRCPRSSSCHRCDNARLWCANAGPRPIGRSTRVSPISPVN